MYYGCMCSLLYIMMVLITENMTLNNQNTYFHTANIRRNGHGNIKS